MPSRNVLERLLAFVDEAIRAGRFRSRADFLAQSGLSRAYLSEFSLRVAANPGATMTLPKAQKCARLLGISVGELTGERDGEHPDIEDTYVGRAWAIQAARNLKYPEAAIQLVLTEDPGVDPGAMYWFRRIESEAQRIRPEQGGPEHGSSQSDGSAPAPRAKRPSSHPSPKR